MLVRTGDTFNPLELRFLFQNTARLFWLLKMSMAKPTSIYTLVLERMTRRNGHISLSLFSFLIGRRKKKILSVPLSTLLQDLTNSIDVTLIQDGEHTL